MANYCWNKLSAPKDVIKDIVNKYILEEDGVKYFEFNLIIPVVDNSESQDYRERDIYIEKWGTKYDGCDVYFEDDIICFATVNSPPIPIIGELAELYKGTEFSLSYEENDLAGEAWVEWYGDKYYLNGESWFI